MSQRNALIAAAAVTAFVLVIVGGLVARLTLPLANAAAPAAASATVPPAEPTPAGDMAVAVSPEMAIAIAQAAAPGASLTRQPEQVLFQGTVAYEVTLDQGAVYVDANTGQVLHNGAAPLFGQPRGEESEEHEHFGEHEFEGGYDD